ncbi:hypothetical protein NHX12_002398 [Muraenolepis orangiensis]|uniref:Uncharacterized protein n=1 Tax=Muraenolepis orangiensis TaxID=630683 RepID=A0A9Q0IEQ1_9TELE|nr:hypothetical protein NHX12_002398 [Muraenolepis orangiensis]
MKLPVLEDLESRFRVASSCVGLVGCLCVCYAVWTPYWFMKRGLWTVMNVTVRAPADEDVLFKAQESEKVFGVLASLMALSSAALCLIFALCWTSRTVHSYSNTRSLLMSGTTLYPTTLLLLTLAPTGFFFLLSWSLFTSQHREEIQQNPLGLGSSYWLGMFGWVILLVVQPALFLVEQCMVPDPLPDLMRSILYGQLPSEQQPTSRSYSNASEPCYSKKTTHSTPRRVVSLA